MTAAEHLAEAERLLNDTMTGDPPYPVFNSEPQLWAGVLHALIAVALEAGVPHDGSTGGVPGGASARTGS